jgi:hypothetical protein
VKQIPKYITSTRPFQVRKGSTRSWYKVEWLMTLQNTLLTTTVFQKDTSRFMTKQRGRKGSWSAGGPFRCWSAWMVRGSSALCEIRNDPRIVSWYFFFVMRCLGIITTVLNYELYICFRSCPLLSLYVSPCVSSLLGFISSLSQLTWNKRLCCCCRRRPALYWWKMLLCFLKKRWLQDNEVSSCNHHAFGAPFFCVQYLSSCKMIC